MPGCTPAAGRRLAYFVRPLCFVTPRQSLAYVLSAVAWALAAGFASTRLRDDWPSAFVRAGSPKPFEFWFNRQLPNSFDRFTLMSKFRALAQRGRPACVG